ncbi:Hsp70 family protein [Thalassotalea hakodatensis]|uniref:Hsp70 family protein n=1 Tax=Thalassotalea hakodatensis TaxID=3030492 RepID=UPI002573700C|nr:Hsp70 family protein [Thalassotalea hakodatensis]
MNIGIDLGTTFTLCAYMNEKGIPALVPDRYDANAFRTPSVMLIDDSGVHVGDTANELCEEDTTSNLWRNAKLDLASDKLFQAIDGKAWKPESVSAVVISKVLADCQMYLTESIKHVVITVPANFNAEQRKATKLAAQMAGLLKVSLVEEPVAAATFYGCVNNIPKSTVLTYDFGGGTFDASILEVNAGNSKVIASDGSNSLGGNDIDELIQNLVFSEFKVEFGLDISQDQESQVKVQKLAEKIKVGFSRPTIRQVKKSIVLQGRAFEFLLTRSQFEELLQPIIDKTLVVCESCLAAAKMNWSSIDEVLFVGGSSMLALAKEKILAVSGKDASTIIQNQPHQAVAFGAAIIAEQIGGGVADTNFQYGATSKAIGISVINKTTGEADMEELIAQNTPLPAKVERTFFTQRNDQQYLVFEILQKGNNEIQPSSLGYFKFGPFLNPKKNLPIKLTLNCDTEGIVHATATDEGSGQELQKILSKEMENAEWIEEQKQLVEYAKHYV